MITGLLVRHYKNYSNMHFIPICDNTTRKYSIFVGNNGVGKSAVLEAIDVVLNDGFWNVSSGQKKSEAFICPIYLVEKDRVSSSMKLKVATFSEFLWNLDHSVNPIFKSNEELKKLLQYKNELKKKYFDDYYFVMIGREWEGTAAYVATVPDIIKSELASRLNIEIDKCQAVLDEIKSEIESLYRYIYIPVESSPNELLKLQNISMQQLLNKNILDEIEKVLNKKQNAKSIVSQINQNLDEFIDEVNNTILKIDGNYQFTNDPGSRRKLTAKDIREKILEAYFPLRTLKVQGHSVDKLSSGEQRKAVIDVIFSVLVANKEKKTEKSIIIAIDEPESSMHVSNCFGQFNRLENLANEYGAQILTTTHWYGFLPITHEGNMLHIETNNDGTIITSFELSNIFEARRRFPDVIDLKSMYDLASSILTYMRTYPKQRWIICEGSDDKVYLEAILNENEEYMILPVGGCGNVVKLYNLLFSPLTEKNENKKGKCLCLIDTDIQMKMISKPYEYSASTPKGIILRRLQIHDDKISLLDPCVPNAYSQTEMEDCLVADIYFEAINNCINRGKNTELKSLIKKFQCEGEVVGSRLKGDNACISPTEIKALKEKQKIIDFAENSENKYLIAEEYRELCAKKEVYPEHMLKEVIEAIMRE